MEFELWPAIVAGLLGGLIMAGMRMMMKAAGVDLKMDIMRVWGSMLGLEGMPGRVAGMIVHLMVSAAIALIYAWGFRDIFNASDNLWLWGLLGGAIHWFLAGLFLGMLPMMHPAIPDKLPAPGIFVKNLGMPDVPGFLMGHLVYGIAVGILYAYFHSMGGTDVAF